MKDTIKTWLQTALPNWLTLLYFEIFYKVIGMTLLTMLADEGSLMSAAAVLLFFIMSILKLQQSSSIVRQDGERNAFLCGSCSKKPFTILSACFT